MDPVFAVKFFGALFAIMNPVTNLPIFISTTDGMSATAQRGVAVKTVMYCAIMGVVIALVGAKLLALFGITVDDFRVAGGLVVLMIGLNMLNGKESTSHHGTDDEKKSYPEAAVVAFYPLTFPIIIGPGTITTLILFSQQAKGTADYITYGLVFAAILAMLGIVFFFAGTLQKYLSATARVIMSRLMGMILAAIAVDMLATGLKALLPGLG